MAKNQIYPYAVARIRMLERTLLTSKQYNQMAEAKSIDEALKILNETGYAPLNGQITVKNYEEALSTQLAKAYQDVNELVSGENFMDVFLLKNDYHNLKVLIKSEISGSEGDKYLIDGGTVDKTFIKNAFLTKSLDTLPSNMKEAVSKAYEVYGKTMSGQMIDIALDKAAFKDMAIVAKKSESNFVKRYVECLCDMTNLKTFLRIKNMKKTFDMFSEVFVEGGSFGIENFRQSFNADNPASGFKSTQYEVVAEYMSQGFTAFEKQCDDYIMSFVKDAKYSSLTLEPMVAYIYARETEAKTIRIILSSKVNKIETDVIKERLRDAYV